ncbi:hypothetical protein I549_4171 [Mycobacterium avium subsp. avium 2285 (R)]|nr:hypothetical protein I549_4171 [Mycobacterium avium subsp. avium 2285 (R)]
MRLSPTRRGVARRVGYPTSTIRVEHRCGTMVVGVRTTPRHTSRQLQE